MFWRMLRSVMTSVWCWWGCSTSAVAVSLTTTWEVWMLTMFDRLCGDILAFGEWAGHVDRALSGARAGAVAGCAADAGCANTKRWCVVVSTAYCCCSDEMYSFPFCAKLIFSLDNFMCSYKTVIWSCNCALRFVDDDLYISHLCVQTQTIALWNLTIT